MMMVMSHLSLREEELLQGLVAAYIRRAEPIASAYLARALALSLSSATIRNALHQIEREGYIEQPHPSAGRVPTDKGYRFYADRVVEEPLSERRQQQLRAQLKDLEGEYGRLNRAAAKLLAELTQSVAIVGQPRTHDIQEAGFQEVLDQPEGQQLQAVRELSGWLDGIDDYLDELAQLDEEGAVTFIGKENPIAATPHLSVLVRQASRGEEKIILVIVGLRRMPYGQNVSWLNSLARIFEEQYL